MMTNAASQNAPPPPHHPTNASTAAPSQPPAPPLKPSGPMVYTVQKGANTLPVEARHYVLEGETGPFKVTGQDAELIHTVIGKAVKINWLMLSVYGVITVLGIVASYYFNGWISIAIFSVVAGVTFFVGWRMVREVITITNNIR